MIMDFDSDGNIIFKEDVVIDKTTEKKAKKPRLDLFKDILKNIVSEKTMLEWDAVVRTYDMFVINRCISNINLHLACRLNECGSKIPAEVHYKLLHTLIQPKKKRFLRFIKQPQLDGNVKILSDFFNINPEKMTLYLRVLSSSDIDKLLETISGLKDGPEKKKF